MKRIERDKILAVMVFAVGIIAAINKEWGLAGGITTGAFALFKAEKETTNETTLPIPPPVAE